MFCVCVYVCVSLGSYFLVSSGERVGIPRPRDGMEGKGRFVMECHSVAWGGVMCGWVCVLVYGEDDVMVKVHAGDGLCFAGSG